MGSHSRHDHVSRGPPIIPDGRVSQVRFGNLAYPPCAFPWTARGLSADSHTPQRARFAHGLVSAQPRRIVGSVSDHRAGDETAKFQSPFAPNRCYRRGEDVSRLLGGRYSSVIALMGSCVNPVTSPRLRPEPRLRSLGRLLSAPAANGTFSTLFCESFLGCPVPCHGGPIECLCLFLPRCHRPSPRDIWVGFPL